MIEYSRDVWNGGIAHPADLSSFGTDIESFLGALQQVLYNVFDALKAGGTYAILLGLWRHPETKELVHLPARILPMAPGLLVNEIVKAQHHTMSGRNDYGTRPFLLTTHEICLVFRKESNSLVGSVVRSLRAAESIENATWLSLVRAFALAKKHLTTTQIYNALERHPLAKKNPSFKAKIRQKLQHLVKDGILERKTLGSYALAP